jgi:hypothetical protein
VKKVDLLLSMVTKMDDDIQVIRSHTEKLMKLMKQVEARSNEFPGTFIIKPRYAEDGSSTTAATKPTSSSRIGRLANKVSNFVSKANAKVRRVFWDESFLVFICPVMMKEVHCGPDGNGFLIQIPTETLKIIVPVLKYGMMFAKVALATQGLGACVPDIGSLLPDVNNEYLNNLAASIQDQIQSSIQDKISSTLDDITTTLDSYSETEEDEALKIVRGLLGDAKQGSARVEDQFGLKLVKAANGDRSMWVSEEGAALYRER